MDLFNLSIYQRLMLSRQLRVSRPTRLLKFPLFCNGKRKIIFNRGKDTDITYRRLCLAWSSGSQILGKLLLAIIYFRNTDTFSLQMSDNTFLGAILNGNGNDRNSLQRLVPCPSVRKNQGGEIRGESWG